MALVNAFSLLTLILQNGLTQGTCWSNNALFGGDGNLYRLITYPGSGVPNSAAIYNYSNLANIAYTVADLQADINTLAITNCPPGSNFPVWCAIWGVRNSNQFMVCATDRANPDHVVFLLYEITNNNFVVKKGFMVTCNALNFGRTYIPNWEGSHNQDRVFDCVNINGTYYVAAAGWGLNSGTEEYAEIIKIAPTLWGTGNLAVASFDAIVTSIFNGGDPINSQNFFNWANSRNIGQRACIFQDANDGHIKVMGYAGLAEIVQNPNLAQPWFTGGAKYTGFPVLLLYDLNNNTEINLAPSSSLLFSDSGLNWAGVGGNNNNDYISPSLIVRGGSQFFIFTRIYNDNFSEIRIRTALLNGTSLDLFDDITATMPPAPGQQTFTPTMVYTNPLNNNQIFGGTDISNAVAPFYNQQLSFSGSNFLQPTTPLYINVLVGPKHIPENPGLFK